ncbi:MAG: hypothetical protein IV097_00445 [Burkholderiaceae bacterium]|nr:hypothetical protein [Burkholderiaceae bacterium]
MTNRGQLKQAMHALIEAAGTVSEITSVPVETLILAMLAVVRLEDADALLEAENCFAPLCHLPAELHQPPGLVPTSGRFEHFLKLIERDNPQLYNKLRNLD